MISTTRFHLDHDHKGLQGFTRKDLQSRSATASLLIKYNKFMQEKIELVIVLVQKSRHIMGTCRGKQRCIMPAERNHMGMGAVEKDMLLILDIISIAQVTGRGGVVVPGYCFNS